jgi:hypothetical protein
MTLNVEIYEMEYSVSPGGVDCWEMTINNKCYSGFKTAGHALDHLLIMHPSDTFDLSVTSLNAYYKELELERI